MWENKTILLVDDELIILESLRIQVSRLLPENVQVEVASSGEEAISLINELKASNENLLLVISDYHLDDMKGTEVLSRVKNTFPAAKIALLTGMADAEAVKVFKSQITPDAVLNKPWNIEAVVQLLENALSQ
jgi:CheY-like chemotaxis protein